MEKKGVKGGVDMTIELTEKEKTMLTEVLKDYIPELRGEIVSSQDRIERGKGDTYWDSRKTYLELSLFCPHAVKPVR